MNLPVVPLEYAESILRHTTSAYQTTAVCLACSLGRFVRISKKSQLVAKRQVGNKDIKPGGVKETDIKQRLVLPWKTGKTIWGMPSISMIWRIGNSTFNLSPHSSVRWPMCSAPMEIPEGAPLRPKRAGLHPSWCGLGASAFLRLRV